jgi:hypothetical protein
MNDSISENRAEAIFNGLAEGTIDLSTITLEEYLQVSFLYLVSTEEIHIEQKVAYAGGIYNLHACVNNISPPERVDNLNREQ